MKFIKTFKNLPSTLLLSLFWSVIVSLAFPFSLFAQSLDLVTQRENELKQELAEIEKEIALQQSILINKQRETVSIERDIDILNAQIESAKLSIKAKNISIERLGKDIGVKISVIVSLEEKIERGKASLAELVRKTREIESYSLVEIVLRNEDLSSFLSDADSFASINGALQNLFEEIRTDKVETETEKKTLDEKRRKEIDARVAIEADKRIIEKAETEKKRLLALSKEQEKAYVGIIKDRERRATEIRNALFSLRDTAAIPFGEALDIAEKAHSLTGVRPAFLLAILTQESNLGANVGTCNRAGDPVEKSWRSIMPGPADKASGRSKRDDQTIYLQIIGELGMNPDTMPLSCPFGTGWGGAMGPAQFIPTTWNLFKSEIVRVTGHNPPNPWVPNDAFMASAIFLRDLGAPQGGYSAERDAACRYYSGRSCDNRKPANAFYGNEVMQKASDIQENMIDPLKGL